MKLILVGATGLVGRHVLQLALADARISAIVAPARRALPAHAKLQAPLVDFTRLPPDAGWWQADAVICTLGTTIKVAGSKAAFRAVDYDYPLAVARLARSHGAPAFVLTSAIGANPDSGIFYNRVKGELEQQLQGLGFASLTCVRPGIIKGERDVLRPGERMMLRVLEAMSPVLPGRWRPSLAPRIAQALLEAALASAPGVHVISSDRLN